MPIAGSYKDLSGQRFGRLVALSPCGRRRRDTVWRAICDCGNTSEVVVYNLTGGVTRSCGCLEIETRLENLSGRRVTHRMTRTTTYYVYQGMRQRCNNPRAPAFSLYGGRGIAVCERWQSSFENFLADMGERPSTLHSLDRIDVSRDYEPANCRWTDWITQGNNRRNVKLIEFGGVKTSLSNHARLHGVAASTVEKRVAAGWPLDAALTTPVRRRA